MTMRIATMQKKIATKKQKERKIEKKHSIKQIL
jgi:hypothetical protein